MIPKSLTDILDKYDSDDFDIMITKVDFESSDLSFDIQVSIPRYNDEEEIIRNWTIETKQYRESKISFDFSSTLQISADHPLLWRFSDIQSSLYFSGDCSEKEKLFFDLYHVHQSLFEDLISFRSSLNSSTNFEKLITSGNGLLSVGPNKLLAEYSKILEKHNLKHSIIGDRNPTYWNGEMHVPESGNAKILFIDDSYIVADQFDFVER